MLSPGFLRTTRRIIRATAEIGDLWAGFGGEAQGGGDEPALLRELAAVYGRLADLASDAAQGFPDGHGVRHDRQQRGGRQGRLDSRR